MILICDVTVLGNRLAMTNETGTDCQWHCEWRVGDYLVVLDVEYQEGDGGLGHCGGVRHES